MFKHRGPLAPFATRVVWPTALGVLWLALAAPAVRAADAVDACVRKELEDGMFLGAVVAAGRPGEMLLCRAYGQRDVGKPMTTDCLFDIASVTKVTTVATALAITLQQHPEISLDDPMRKYLSGMKGKGAEQVTIRDMAGHRSGLDNTKELCAKYAGEELVRQIIARDNRWPVGSRWEYSCLGMVRLGEMIAAVNATPFGDFCEQRIFTPLGMADTFFSPVPVKLQSRCVATTGPLGVVEDQNARRIGRPVGNAGVFSTAGDLARLATLWLGKGEYGGQRLFSAKIADAFTSGSIVWRRDNTGELPDNASPGSFFHTGYTGQTLILDPERNAYIIVLSAWSHPCIKASKINATRARARIATTLIEEFLDKPRKIPSSTSK